MVCARGGRHTGINSPRTELADELGGLCDKEARRAVVKCAGEVRAQADLGCFDVACLDRVEEEGRAERLSKHCADDC